MNFSNAVKIRPRRGTVNQWESLNPILDKGEIGLEYSNEGISAGNIKLKVGDGTTAWNSLPYSFSGKDAIAINAGGVTDNDKYIVVKCGTTAEWMLKDPVLKQGEIVCDTTINEMKIGDGVHKFSELKYIGQTWDKSVIFDFGDYDA